jgi:hypothetical protein
MEVSESAAFGRMEASETAAEPPSVEASETAAVEAAAAETPEAVGGRRQGQG